MTGFHDDYNPKEMRQEVHIIARTRNETENQIEVLVSDSRTILMVVLWVHSTYANVFLFMVATVLVPSVDNVLFRII